MRFGDTRRKVPSENNMPMNPPQTIEPQGTVEHEPKLVVLDGMALIYRAHFAMIRNPRQTSTGLCTSAVNGFCNTLLGILDRERPSHLVAALDAPDRTHRHAAYDQYKANRQAMPEDLRRRSRTSCVCWMPCAFPCCGFRATKPTTCWEPSRTKQSRQDGRRTWSRPTRIAINW